MVRTVSPRMLRWLMNIWPPFAGAGIRVRHIAPDFRSITAEMPLRWYNRNYVGTHFGGSLYSITDPFLMIMLIRNLGSGYRVWDKSGSIEYIAPGRGRMWLRVELREAELAQVRRMTEAGDKHLHVFSMDITDDESMVVARVQKVIYIRRKLDAKPGETSANQRSTS